MHKKILYLHGRPAPHKLHGRFAESINSTFQHVDDRMRWQDRNRSIPYRLLSWFLNAISYPRDYDYYLVDNLHMAPVLLKKLKLISSEQKIIAHLGSHTLYFMYSKWFGTVTNIIHRFMLRSYDILLCEGKMAEDLVHTILGKNSPKTIYTFLGPPQERARMLRAVKPSLDRKQMLHISSGPNGFRTHYKGIMDMIEALDLVLDDDPEVTLTIVGAWSDQVMNQAYAKLGTGRKNALEFTGITNDVERYLQNSSLYLHCTNGDAFPTSTVEAMTAGLVPIVSEWTGTKEIVEKIHCKLVAPMVPDIIADRIIWFFNLSLEEKQLLSARSRAACKHFTEEKAIKHYQNIFQNL